MSGPLEIGDVIDGRYEIQSVLGQGGFGVVYGALQRSTGQRVAIKLLLDSKTSGGAQRAQLETARFEREMQLIAVDVRVVLGQGDAQPQRRAQGWTPTTSDSSC